MEVNYKLILAGMFFFVFTGAVVGAVVGTIITQEELDNKTREQIEADVVFSRMGNFIHKTDRDVVFNYDYTNILRSSGAYVNGDTGFLQVTYDRVELNNCISDFSLDICVVTKVNPKIVSGKKFGKKLEVDKILGWQTKTPDLFTIEDLESRIISDKKLNAE